jgi:hypothetical protein
MSFAAGGGRRVCVCVCVCVYEERLLLSKIF